MKVVFIGKSHIFSILPLNEIRRYHEVIALIESGPRGKEALIDRTKRFIREIRACVDREMSLRRIAAQSRIPYRYMTKSGMKSLVQFLEPLKPDIICVASLSFLLPPAALKLPKFGAINLHPSLLPRYHGPFPWFWQYYDFLDEIGVTVHALDAGQDTGPIIKQDVVPLALGTDIAQAIDLVSPVGARLMVEAITVLATGTVVLAPQPIHQFPKARVVKPNEKLIKWDEWPIERVWHFMRGTYPWLNVTEDPKFSHGKWRPTSIEKIRNAGQVGALHRDDKGYYIAHADGKIRIVQAG